MICAAEESTATLDGLDVPARGPADDADFSLSALVRQWLKTSEAVERQSRPEDGDAPMRPTWTPPMEDRQVIVPAARLADDMEESPVVPQSGLPRRRRQPHMQLARRLAVLIDVASTTPESADALFDLLQDQGTVSVCRAYADWTSPAARGWWSAPLRQHGIQPYHHFGHDRDRRSLVALTIDAVDLARESAVDVVVLVGDLVSLHPLVVRLNASGLQVIAFGTTSTPDDVRALCHEFVDLSPAGILDSVQDGKHRA